MTWDIMNNSIKNLHVAWDSHLTTRDRIYGAAAPYSETQVDAPCGCCVTAICVRIHIIVSKHIDYAWWWNLYLNSDVEEDDNWRIKVCGNSKDAQVLSSPTDAPSKN